MKKLTQYIVSRRRFERFVVDLMVINGIILGLETIPRLEAQYGWWLHFGNQAISTGEGD